VRVFALALRAFVLRLRDLLAPRALVVVRFEVLRPRPFAFALPAFALELRDLVRFVLRLRDLEAGRALVLAPRDFEAGRALVPAVRDFEAERALVLELRDLLVAPGAFLTLVARNLVPRTVLATRDFELRDLERAFELRLRAAEGLRDLAAHFFVPRLALFEDLARHGLESTGFSFMAEGRLTGVQMRSRSSSALAVFFVDIGDFLAAGLAARARLHGTALVDLRFRDVLRDRDVELTAELLRFLVLVAFFVGARARWAVFSSDGLVEAVRTAKLL